MQVDVKYAPRTHDQSTGISENNHFPVSLRYQDGVLVEIIFALQHTVFINPPKAT